jgi:hypothetical protein
MILPQNRISFKIINSNFLKKNRSLLAIWAYFVTQLINNCPYYVTFDESTIMEFKRNIEDYLYKWKLSPVRKPLLLRFGLSVLKLSYTH